MHSQQITNKPTDMMRKYVRIRKTHVHYNVHIFDTIERINGKIGFQMRFACWQMLCRIMSLYHSKCTVHTLINTQLNSYVISPRMCLYIVQSQSASPFIVKIALLNGIHGIFFQCSPRHTIIIFSFHLIYISFYLWIK